MSWAPNSLYVASGGLDTGVIIWSVEAPDKHCVIRWEQMGVVYSVALRVFDCVLELYTLVVNMWRRCSLLESSCPQERPRAEPDHQRGLAGQLQHSLHWTGKYMDTWTHVDTRGHLDIWTLGHGDTF